MGRKRIDETTGKVRAFYEDHPFPGYEEFDDLAQLIARARRSSFATLLNDLAPFGGSVLEVGCGTGQLSLYLSVASRNVLGIDLSNASLAKGADFAKRFGLKNVAFRRSDLFSVDLPERSFDMVIANGVLHHTADPRLAFKKILRFVRPGGLVVVGLYNSFGRLTLAMRRVLFRIFGGRSKAVRSLDGVLSEKDRGSERKEIWYFDQYDHPHESSHTVDEVLGWLRDEGCDFAGALPPVAFGNGLEIDGTPMPEGPRWHHLLHQLGWIFTRGREGGLFVIIGRVDGKAQDRS